MCQYMRPVLFGERDIHAGQFLLSAVVPVIIAAKSNITACSSFIYDSAARSCQSQKCSDPTESLLL